MRDEGYWRIKANKYARTAIDLFRLPEEAAELFAQYIVYGAEPGGFIKSVLIDSLSEAASKADGNNLRLLKEYSQFVYNYAPYPCSGSREMVREWIRVGGLKGFDDATFEEVNKILQRRRNN